MQPSQIILEYERTKGYITDCAEMYGESPLDSLNGLIEAVFDNPERIEINAIRVWNGDNLILCAIKPANCSDSITPEQFEARLNRS